MAESGGQGGRWPTLFGIPYPTDYIVAAFRQSAQAEAAAEGLRAAGFRAVALHTGREVYARAEQAKEHQSVLEKVATNILSQDAEFLDQYIDAAKQGATFLTARAEGEETIRRAQPILRDNRGYFARHYGKLVVTDLSGDDNRGR